MNREMQVVTTRSADYLRHGVPGAPELGQLFPALFVVAGAKGVSPETLRTKLGLSAGRFNALLHRLQMGYLVDVISERRDGGISESIRLTEEGTSALQRMMETMCELPELE